MKKSTVSPKELSNRRLIKSKLMRVPYNEGIFTNKENVNPPFINIKKKTNTHDRELKESKFINPFNIPDHMRVFSKTKGHRKDNPVPFIMSEPHTICDIDDTFYKVIEGRPLRQFADVKVYMRNIRDITLFKANAAYLNDQILQFENSFVFEMEQYKQIQLLYEKTKTNFVQFARESYEKAKAVQRTAEERSLEVTKVSDQLELVCFRYVKLRNQLSSIEFSFGTLVKYGKFLNKLSPDTWRAEFDHLNKQKYNLVPRTGDVASTSFVSIDDYRSSFERIKDIKPQLHFKRPGQIMAVYDDMSRQCLNYMNINVLATSMLTSVQSSLHYLKTELKFEIDEMEDFLKSYASNVLFLETKEIYYKGMFENLIVTEFQTLYASTDSTKLFTCVQYGEYLAAPRTRKTVLFL